MCPLSSLRTPLPLDFRKLQLDSSKAIKLSTDKNKRMWFFFLRSLLFLCLFIPLSPFCSSLYPLPYPPLGLRALPNLSLSLSPSLPPFPLSLIIRSLPTRPPVPLILPPPLTLPCTNASPCLVVYHLLLDSCLRNIHQRGSLFSFLNAI